ncbi:hypothetical protein [Pontibacillus sp. HMF3514]|uniref:hypothetical protein n=1 Tax=Pontibacillus sp. HMF3514 TaxID=2692425 RepID=UPI001F31E205|nr:hypothetical protein [Pontibacillus sp. HMF3514]
MTDAQVTQSLLVDEYYVKISSDEFDFNVVRDYLKKEGWKEIKHQRMGGLYVFERDGKIKRIINTQVKTIFIDGKLNL